MARRPKKIRLTPQEKARHFESIEALNNEPPAMTCGLCRGLARAVPVVLEDPRRGERVTAKIVCPCCSFATCPHRKAARVKNLRRLQNA